MKNRVLKSMALTVMLLFAVIIKAQTVFFTSDVESGISPLVVSFTNLSNFPTADLITWDFGDGTQSTEVNPVHTFTSPGAYYVMLTMTNQTTSESYYWQQTINVYKIGDVCQYPETVMPGTITAITGSLNSSVWYSYTPAQNERVEITTCGTSKYPGIYYTFDCTKPINNNSIACSAGDGNHSIIDVPQGVTLYFQLDIGFNQTIDWSLNTSLIPAGSSCQITAPVIEGSSNITIPQESSFYQKVLLNYNAVVSYKLDGTTNYYINILKDCNSNINYYYSGDTINFIVEKSVPYQILTYIYGTMGNSTPVTQFFSFTPYTPQAGEFCSAPIIALPGRNDVVGKDNSNVWYSYTAAKNGYLEIKTCNYEKNGSSTSFSLYNDCSNNSINTIYGCDQYSSYAYLNVNQTVLFNVYKSNNSINAYDVVFSGTDEANILFMNSPVQTSPPQITGNIINLNVAYSADIYMINLNLKLSPNARLLYLGSEYTTNVQIDGSTSPIPIQIISADNTVVKDFQINVTQSTTPLSEKEIISFNVNGAQTFINADTINVILENSMQTFLGTNFVLSPMARLLDPTGTQINQGNIYSFKVGMTEIFSTVAEDNSSKNWFIKTKLKQGIECTNPVPAIVGLNVMNTGMNTNYLWYTYTAPENQSIEVSTCGAFSFPSIYYTLDCIDNQYVSNNCSDLSGSIWKQDLLAGQTIKFRIENSYNSTLNWNLNIIPLTVGTSCISAIQLNPGISTTKIPYEQNFWQNITVAQSSKIFIKNGINLNPSFSIYKGCNEPVMYTFMADTISFTAEAGQNYSINWYFNGESGDSVVMQQSVDVVPYTLFPGETCSNAISALEGQNVVTGSDYNDIWYTYTSTIDGFLELKTCSYAPGQNIFFSIFENCSNVFLQDIQGCVSYDSYLQMNAGQTIYFRINKSPNFNNNFDLIFTGSDYASIKDINTSFKTQPNVFNANNVIDMYVSSSAPISNLWLDFKLSPLAKLNINGMPSSSQTYVDAQDTVLITVESPDGINIYPYKLIVHQNLTLLSDKEIVSINFSNAQSQIIGDTILVILPNENMNNQTLNFTLSPMAQLFTSIYEPVYPGYISNFYPFQNQQFIARAEDGTEKIWNFKVVLQPGTSCLNPIVVTLDIVSSDFNNTNRLWYKYTAITSGILEISSCEWGQYVAIGFISDCSSGYNYSYQNCQTGSGSYGRIPIIAGQTYTFFLESSSSQVIPWRLSEIQPEPGSVCFTPVQVSIGDNTISIPKGVEYWQSFTSTDFSEVRIAFNNNLVLKNEWNFSIYDNCFQNGNIQYSMQQDTIIFYTDRNTEYKLRWFFYDNSTINLTNIVENVSIKPYSPAPGTFCSIPLNVQTGVNTINLLNGKDNWYDYLAPQDGFIVANSCKYDAFNNTRFEFSKDCNSSGNFMTYGCDNNYYSVNANDKILLKVNSYSIGKNFDFNFYPRNNTQILSIFSPYQIATPVISGNIININITYNFDFTTNELPIDIKLAPEAQTNSGSGSNGFYTVYVSPVNKTFTVYAADGTTQQIYTVNITKATAPQTGNDILTFSVPQANVQKLSNNITIELPNINSTCNNFSFTLSPMAKLYDEQNYELQNNTTKCFTLDSVYKWKVVAENGISKTWNIVFTNAPGTTCTKPIYATIGENITTTSSYGDIYFKYTTASAGNLIISTCGTDIYNISLSKDCNGYGLEYYNKPCTISSGSSYVINNVLPGQTFYISFYINYSDTRTFKWTITEQTPLPGESCDMPAQAVLGQNIVPANLLSNEMYYTYRATKNGIITINTCNSANSGFYFNSVRTSCNTYLQKYNYGSCDGSNGGVVSFQSEIGKLYYFVFNNNNNGIQNEWTLNEREVFPGESCEMPIIAFEGINTAAPYGLPEMRETFFSYTATQSGVVTISSCGYTDANTRVFVTNGNCAMSDIIAFSDDACAMQSLSKFEVIAGNSYIINWGCDGYTSSFNWELSFNASEQLPQGQSCSNPVVLTEGQNDVIFNGNLFWMEYTAPGNGYVTMASIMNDSVLPYIQESEMYVLENCQLNSGVEYTHPNDTSTRFFVTSGFTYKLLAVFQNAPVNKGITSYINFTNYNPVVGEICGKPIQVFANNTYTTIKDSASNWYLFTANQDGVIVLNSCGFTQDRTLSRVQKSCTFDITNEGDESGTAAAGSGGLNDYEIMNSCNYGSTNVVNVIKDSTYMIKWINYDKKLFSWNIKFFPRNFAKFLSYRIEQQVQNPSYSITGDTINFVVGNTADLTKLNAFFSLAPYTKAFVGSIRQNENSFSMDFTKPVVYRIFAADSSYHDYTISVTKNSTVLTDATIEVFNLENQISSNIDNINRSVEIVLPWNINNCLKLTLKTSPMSFILDQNSNIVNYESEFCLGGTNPLIWNLNVEDGSVIQYSIYINVETAPVGGLCSDPIAINLNQVISSSKDVKNYYFTLPDNTSYYQVRLITPKYNSNYVQLMNDPCGVPVQQGDVYPYENKTFIFRGDAVLQKFLTFNYDFYENYSFIVEELTNLSEKEIISCNLSLFNGSNNQYIEPIINSASASINVTVPYNSDLANVYVDLGFSSGAKAMIEGMEFSSNYSNQVNFDVNSTLDIAVAALDGTVKNWKLIISRELPNTQTEILSFYLKNQVTNSIIDKANHTITATMPFGYDLSALTPFFSSSLGAKCFSGTNLITSGSSVIDFSGNVPFNIVAQDGVTQTLWTIIVNEQVVPLSDFIVPDSVVIEIGSTYELFIDFIPSNASNKALTITNSDPLIATYTGSIITAKTIGSSVLSFISSDGSNITKTLKVKVIEKYVPVLGIALPSTATVTTGFETVLTSLVYPSDATNQSLIWVVDDPTIAQVSATGIVSGKTVGKTMVYAKSVDNSSIVSNACEVTVTGVQVTGIVLSKTGTVNLNKDNTLALTATVSPTNAYDKKIIWLSSDPAIATVDSTGKVKAIAGGSAVIKAISFSNSSVIASVTINVVVVTVNKTALQSSISTANQLIASAIIGTSPGNYPQVSVDNLQAVVAESQTVMNSATATQAQVDYSTFTLDDAIVKFKNSQIGTIKIVALNLMQEEVITRVVNDPVALKTTILPTNASNKALLWTCSDSTVISITKDGILDATKPGTAYVYVATTDGSNLKDSCLVKVVIPVERVVAPEIISVVVGTAQQIDAFVMPTNADNKNLTWSSSDSSIVLVTSLGQVVGIKEGVAQITVKALDNGKSAICLVYVVTEAIPVTGVSIIPELTLILGDEYKMTSTVTPINATNKATTWSSSDGFVAYVNQTGTLKTFSPGEAVVTITTIDGGFVSTCNVTVLASYPPVISGVKPKVAPLDNSTITVLLSNKVTDDNTEFADLVFSPVSNSNFTISVSGEYATISPVSGTWMGTDTVHITVTDNDGISSIMSIPVTITNVSNKAPVLSIIPSQLIREGGSYTPMHLSNYVTDDYTAVDSIKWSVTTSSANILPELDVDKLIVTIVNNSWIGVDSITVTATDENGLTISQKVGYGVSDVANGAPVISPFDPIIQNNDITYSPIILADFVTDDFTMPQSISWAVGVTEKLNVEVINGVLNIEVADLYWAGTEEFELYAMDEEGASDTTIINFTQEVILSENWHSAPLIEFSATPLIAGPGQSVDLSASLIGADSWKWILTGATFNVADNAKLKRTISYANPGKYSISLIAMNSYGVDTLVKEDYVTVIGLPFSDSTICEGNSITLTTTTDGMAGLTYSWNTGENVASITKSPGNETTYTVTITKGLFEYIDQVTVRVSKALKLGVDTSLCQGQSVRVEPQGFDEFNWNGAGWVTDSTYTILDQAGTLSLAVKDSIGCISSDEITIIEMYNLPVVDLGADKEICSGSATTLDAGAGFTYAWSTSETSQTISVNTENTYSVTVEDINGCINSDAINVTVLLPYQEELGVATFSETGTSIILGWERTEGQRTARYEIMRETGALNVYEQIGTVPFNNPSFFIDTDANSTQKSFKYKLVTVDSVCGNKAESAYHKTMHLQNNLSLDNHANLIWESYEGIAFSSYIIYKGTNSTDLVQIDVIASDKTSWTSTDEYISGDIYRVAILLPTPIDPSTLKSDSGPYSQSISNLSEAELTGLVDLNISFTAYPIPANNKLHVILDSDLSGYSASIINTAGMKVMDNISLVNGKSTIDVSDLTSGTYTLVITSGKVQVTKQIIIE